MIVLDNLQEGDLGHTARAVVVVHMVGEVEDRISRAVLGDTPWTGEEDTLGVSGAWRRVEGED